VQWTSNLRSPADRPPLASLPHLPARTRQTCRGQGWRARRSTAGVPVEKDRPARIWRPCWSSVLVATRHPGAGGLRG
jgi:hypothetical protein